MLKVIPMLCLKHYRLYFAQICQLQCKILLSYSACGTTLQSPGYKLFKSMYVNEFPPTNNALQGAAKMKAYHIGSRPALGRALEATQASRTKKVVTRDEMGRETPSGSIFCVPHHNRENLHPIASPFASKSQRLSLDVDASLSRGAGLLLVR